MANEENLKPVRTKSEVGNVVEMAARHPVNPGVGKQLSGIR